ncbi:hypothetical protein PWT90_07588 [Aphanocladium album]|nr:hypothetical protein PWT90_07588 [Aphanocladium album]
MAKRAHTLALADDQSTHLTSSRFAGNSTEWQYPSIFSLSYGSVGLHRAKRVCPCGNCHRSKEPQSKGRCAHGLQPEAPISISSSDSGWSTSPQRLSAKDMSRVEPIGMTLRIGDDINVQYPSGYRSATQNEALLGCGSWINEHQTSSMVPSMPFEEAMVDQTSRAVPNRPVHPKHDIGKS